MKRNSIVAMVLILTGMCFASLAPWPVQPEYYGVLAHWRMNDHQVAGAVAQYKLDDEAANTVVDNNLGTDGTWGHGNTDQHDAASWCANFGQSLEFDGSNDYIDTNQTFESTFQSSFSISMWVQPHDGQPDDEQCLMGVTDTNGQFVIFLYDDRLSVNYLGIEADTDSTIFQDGENNWHNIVVVVPESDPHIIQIYLDGVEAPLNSEVAGDVSGVNFNGYTTSRNLFIGAINDGYTFPNKFDGRMDNVTIYDRALTAEDVAWLATCGTQSTESSMYTVEGSDADGKDLTAAVSISNLADPNGPITGCFTFDGTNDYLAMSADDDDLDFDTDDDFSISFWIKRDLLNETDRIVEKIGTSGAGWVVQVNQYGCMYLYRTNGTNWTATLSATDDACDGDWHHVVCVRDAGSPGKVYIDGVDDTSPYSNPSESLDLRNSAHLHVGCNVYHLGKLTGSLDDLIVFNRALTAAEVEALYERGTQDDYSRELSSPLYDWRFLEDMRQMLYITKILPNGDAGFDGGYPDLSEFQEGGDYADPNTFDAAYLLVSYEDEVYANAVSVSTPLSGSLDPSTDPNWVLMCNRNNYRHFDAGCDRYWVTENLQLVHGHALLPTQVDPYAQSYGEGIHGQAAISYQSVTITGSILSEYLTWLKDLSDGATAFVHWDEIADDDIQMKAVLTLEFVSAYESITGLSFSVGDIPFEDTTSECFGANGSMLEYLLMTGGEETYHWMLDTNHVDDQNDEDYYAFHPRYRDANGDWVEWNEQTNGYIQAVWRRVPRFTELNWEHTDSDILWPGVNDENQLPPGIEENKNGDFRDRYIRCTLATKDEPIPLPVPDCNSLTLAEVMDEYQDVSFGKMVGENWVPGSDPIHVDGGSVAYTTLEADTSLSGNSISGNEKEYVDAFCSLIPGGAEPSPFNPDNPSVAVLLFDCSDFNLIEHVSDGYWKYNEENPTSFSTSGLSEEQVWPYILSGLKAFDSLRSVNPSLSTDDYEWIFGADWVDVTSFGLCYEINSTEGGYQVNVLGTADMMGVVDTLPLGQPLFNPGRPGTSVDRLRWPLIGAGGAAAAFGTGLTAWGLYDLWVTQQPYWLCEWSEASLIVGRFYGAFGGMIVNAYLASQIIQDFEDLAEILDNSEGVLRMYRVPKTIVDLNDAALMTLWGDTGTGDLDPNKVAQYPSLPYTVALTTAGFRPEAWDSSKEDGRITPHQTVQKLNKVLMDLFPAPPRFGYPPKEPNVNEPGHTLDSHQNPMNYDRQGSSASTPIYPQRLTPMGSFGVHVDMGNGGAFQGASGQTDYSAFQAAMEAEVND